MSIVTGAYTVYDCIKLYIRNDNLKEVKQIIKTKATNQQENSDYNKNHEGDLFEEIVNNYTGSWLTRSSSSHELIKVLRRGPNNTLEMKKKALRTYLKDKKNHSKRLFKDIIKTLRIEKGNSESQGSYEVILPKIPN